MRKMRLTLLTVCALALLAAVVWIGCSTDNSTAPNASITDWTANNPQAVAKVIQAQATVEDGLMKTPGVVGVATSTDDNGNLAIRVFTNSQVTTAIPKMAKTPDGIPVVYEETGPFTASALTGTYRPVVIGVSVGNDNECAAGTIGCIVTKGGVKYILSNNHVLARENAAAIGEKIDQPGRYETRCKASGQVATLSAFQAISFSGNNTIDAAIAQFVSGITVSASTPSGYYGFPGSTTIAPSVNLKVKKVGRTTSLTTGTISSINATVSVGYTNGTATFTGQFVTSKNFTKSGDSGSLVVTNDGKNNPVGLLFAGSSAGNAICNPIGPVLSKFGVTIVTQ
jgi:hypothetical protein